MNWDAWKPSEPSPGFADRVMDRIERETDREEAAPKSVRSLRGQRIATVSLLVAAAAAVVLLVTKRAPDSGSIKADKRMDVPIDRRAVAVVESGARIEWHGSDVTQKEGDVFYRVEKGGPFVVHTPSGDLHVKGTCFRVKVRRDSDAPPDIDVRVEEDVKRRDWVSGGVGAIAGALVFVGVYEGRVAFTDAKGGVDVLSGESVSARGGNLTKGDLVESEKAFDKSASAQAGPGAQEPLLEANRNLADSVKRYKDRIAAIEEEKGKLEKQLEAAQLQAAMDGGRLPVDPMDRNDMTQDDWKELAKDGSMKVRIPCMRGADWKPNAEFMEKLGLAPTDADAVREAWKNSNSRVEEIVRPLCAKALGDPKIAERISIHACQTIVRDVAMATNREAASDALYTVGEVRGGLRPMPEINDQSNPLLRMLMPLTGELSNFEAELAKSFGPDQAHRIIAGDEGCWSNSSSSGPGPRKK